jgi:hypothetical protein
MKYKKVLFRKLLVYRWNLVVHMIKDIFSTLKDVRLNQTSVYRVKSMHT